MTHKYRGLFRWSDVTNRPSQAIKRVRSVTPYLSLVHLGYLVFNFSTILTRT